MTLHGRTRRASGRWLRPAFACMMPFKGCCAEWEILMSPAKLFARVTIALGVAAGSAAQAQDIQKLFIEGDIVRGNTPLGATGPICVLTSQFKRGENVVFRIRVRNPQGRILDDKGLNGIVV